MKKVFVAGMLVTGGLSSIRTVPSGPTMGFFGGGGMSVANFCYWYPHKCRNGRIIGSQPCYISIRLENGVRRVPCGKYNKNARTN
jgi:hypothetical protein